MTSNTHRLRQTTVTTCCVACLLALAAGSSACDFETRVEKATVEEVTAFFSRQSKTVVTFVGYSGAGYEDDTGMLETAAAVLKEFEPSRTIVNIGGTPEGIGIHGRPQVAANPGNPADPHAGQAADMQSAIEGLRQRLAASPDDVEGWLLLARTLTSVDAKPIVSVMTRTVSASGIDWGVLAAAGVLTILPGMLVIWFVRNHVAKGFALGRV